MTNTNEVILTGEITNPEYDYTAPNDELFYKAEIRVRRFSGTVDKIQVSLPDCVAARIEGPCEVSLKGQLRTRNQLDVNGRSHLQVYFFADDFNDTSEINYIYIKGYLCKPPQYRITPMNREIADIMVAVNRSNKRSDYIPCIAWGRNARWVDKLSVGTQVEMKGRVQSREYRKVENGKEVVKTAYEVSISWISEIRDGNEEDPF